MSVKRICKDTFFDAFRYTMKAKYGYKKRIGGKDRLTWDLILGIGIAVLSVAFVFACWIFTKFTPINKFVLAEKLKCHTVKPPRKYARCAVTTRRQNRNVHTKARLQNRC